MGEPFRDGRIVQVFGHQRVVGRHDRDAPLSRLRQGEPRKPHERMGVHDFGTKFVQRPTQHGRPRLRRRIIGIERVGQGWHPNDKRRVSRAGRMVRGNDEHFMPPLPQSRHQRVYDRHNPIADGMVTFRHHRNPHRRHHLTCLMGFHRASLRLPPLRFVSVGSSSNSSAINTASATSRIGLRVSMLRRCRMR